MPTKKRPVQHEDITHLLSRALMDHKFRDRLLENPEKELDELGFEHAPKTVKIIKSLGGKDGQFGKAVHDAKLDGVQRAGDC
jgi:hypothetical protein